MVSTSERDYLFWTRCERCKQMALAEYGEYTVKRCDNCKPIHETGQYILMSIPNNVPWEGDTDAQRPDNKST